MDKRESRIEMWASIMEMIMTACVLKYIYLPKMIYCLYVVNFVIKRLFMLPIN